MYQHVADMLLLSADNMCGGLYGLLLYKFCQNVTTNRLRVHRLQKCFAAISLSKYRPYPMQLFISDKVHSNEKETQRTYRHTG